MAAIPGATELLPLPDVGRRFAAERKVRLGDVDPGGRLRLDATGRYLQDVASDDATDAALDGAWGWVVRRTMIEVTQPAVLDEVVTLTTYCTGLGRSWAERSTQLSGSLGAAISAVSLWVQVAADTGRPAALTEHFMATYGPACDNRKVSARLQLGRPETATERTTWAVRRADLDPFDHVNNAANFAFVEESVGHLPGRCGRAEMEFVAPVTHGTTVDRLVGHESAGDDVGDGREGDGGDGREGDGVTSMWLLDGDSVLSAARWTPFD